MLTSADWFYKNLFSVNLIFQRIYAFQKYIAYIVLFNIYCLFFIFQIAIDVLIDVS